MAFLVCTLIWLLPNALGGHDMAANFIVEIFGLFFTLVAFMIFFDLRESLKWKAIEAKVKRRIGRQVRTIFTELTILCEVESVIKGTRIHDGEAWNDLSRRQLNQLVSSQVSLSKLGKELLDDSDQRHNLRSFLDSRRIYLSDLEGKYLRFLSSELQESLMDMQDSLEKLCFEMKVRRTKADAFHKAITDLIAEIMSQIARARKHGLDIGF